MYSTDCKNAYNSSHTVSEITQIYKIDGMFLKILVQLVCEIFVKITNWTV